MAMSKNIVLCSDGTGNTVLKGRNTNVVKLFEAIDHEWRETDPGKPTIEASSPFTTTVSARKTTNGLRAITGAFGIGVKRNVKRLHATGAVYEPGDQIYLFGFSRALILRMLAAAHCRLRHHQAAQPD